MIRPIRLAALALVASTGLTVVASTGAAGSDQGTATAHQRALPASTPLQGYADMAVDTPLARVFVSEGVADKVAVLSMFGKPIDTIAGITGAHGITLSPDGSTLYVTEPELSQVVAIDATSFALTATYDLPAESDPLALTYSDGMLWFGQETAAGDTIGAIDPVTGTVYPDLAATVNGETGPTILGSSPAVPGTVIGGYDAIGTYALYHVTGGAAPTATLVKTADLGSRATTLAFTPDGSGVVIAPGSPYYHMEISTADLSLIRIYRTEAYPDAAAVRADGMVAAGMDAGGNAIDLFVPGQDSLYGHDDFGRSGSWDLLDNGLAFGPQHLFAVTGSPDGRGPFEFRWLIPKRRPNIFIRATPLVSNYGATETVTAHVTNAGANRTVSMYAQSAGGLRHLIGRGTLSDTGYFSAHTRMTVFTHFTAVLGGDAQTMTVSAVTTAKTRAGVSDWLQDYYASSGTYRLFHVTTNPTERTLVSPNHHGDCVTFELQFRYAGQPWGYDQSTPCGRLSSSSHEWVTLVGTHHVGEMVRIRTRFPGAFPNAPQDGLWRYLRFTK